MKTRYYRDCFFNILLWISGNRQLTLSNKIQNLYRRNRSAGFRIGQDFSQYTVGEDDEEYNDFLKEKIGNFECILLGKENVSARGFELSYDDKTGSYEIRIFTPSAVADYETAFDYLKKLCAFLGNNKITTEDNETYTADTITAYNYKEQIGYALEAIYNNLKNSDHEHFEIFGLHRPVALNKKIIKEIIKTKETVEKFQQFYYKLAVYRCLFRQTKNLRKR